MKNTNYECGRGEEIKLARKLKKAGAKVTLSPGSRGGFDMLADFGTGKRKLAIQLKATCKTDGKAKSVTPKEKQRLIKESKENRATPVVAKKENGKFSLKYAIADRDVKL
jgi:Holliday junction resolvase